MEHVKEGAHVLTESIYPNVVALVASNCFRSLPPPPARSEVVEVDEDEPAEDIQWPHLELVYQLFVDVLQSKHFDKSLAKKYISEEFLLNLLVLFDSEDVRERCSLKGILHKLYGKFTAHRAFLRVQMQNVFLHHAFESEHFTGIAELLEIFASIIHGYVVPLKDEHNDFFAKVLIPLHKCHTLPLYHTQLTYCCILFVEKDASLVAPLVAGILKYWPKTSSQKEVLFLVELEEILDGLSGEQFAEVMVPVFQKLSSCMCSSHLVVVEKSLLFSHNDYIMQLVEFNSTVIFPIVLPSLLAGRRAEHLNETLSTQMDNLVNRMTKMNGKLCEQLMKINQQAAKANKKEGQKKNGRQDKGERKTSSLYHGPVGNEVELKSNEKKKGKGFRRFSLSK